MYSDSYESEILQIDIHRLSRCGGQLEMNSQRKLVITMLIIVAVLIVAFLIYSFYTDRFVNKNVNNNLKSPNVNIDFDKTRVGVPVN